MHERLLPLVACVLAYSRIVERLLKLATTFSATYNPPKSYIFSYIGVKCRANCEYPFNPPCTSTPMFVFMEGGEEKEMEFVLEQFYK